MDSPENQRKNRPRIAKAIQDELRHHSAHKKSRKIKTQSLFKSRNFDLREIYIVERDYTGTQMSWRKE